MKIIKKKTFRTSDISSDIHRRKNNAVLLSSFCFILMTCLGLLFAFAPGDMFLKIVGMICLIFAFCMLFLISFIQIKFKAALRNIANGKFQLYLTPLIYKYSERDFNSEFFSRRYFLIFWCGEKCNEARKKVSKRMFKTSDEGDYFYVVAIPLEKEDEFEFVLYKQSRWEPAEDLTVNTPPHEQCFQKRDGIAARVMRERGHLSIRNK